MISGLGTYRFFRSALTPLLRAALVSAVLVHVALLILFQPTVTIQKQEPMREVSFSCPGWGRERQEQLSLSDSEPLYLPTVLNYGYKGGIGHAGEVNAQLGGAPLEGFSPELQVREGAPLEIPAGVSFIVPAVDAVLSLRHWGVAATLGRQPQPGKSALEARQAFMRVERLSDGGVVFSKPIKLGLSAVQVGEAWHPAAFSYWVDLQGMVGAPVPVPWTDGVVGAGNAAVTEAMRRFLVQEPLAQALSPGQYRVIIGP